MGITSNKPRIIIIITLLSALAFAIIAFLYFKSDSSPQTNPVIVDESLINKEVDLSRSYSRTIFAKDLKDPRDILVTPGGTVLVSLPSQGRVVALPDRNADGEADRQLDIVSDLNSPHGLAFYGGKLFVASQNALNRYSWDEKLTRASLERRLLNLPLGGRHITRSLAFDRDGNLFLSLGKIGRAHV